MKIPKKKLTVWLPVSTLKWIQEQAEQHPEKSLSDIVRDVLTERIKLD